MDTNEFDQAVVVAVFETAGLVGWRDMTLASAAQDSGLDLARLRVRFPDKLAFLLRFGLMADQAALAAAPSTGLPRERVFDLLMARFDVLQPHRMGVLALIEAMRRQPGTAALLFGATLRSMRWMLDAAGVPTGGVLGTLRVQGMGAVWAYALRAWEKDESADMSATMAAIDRALDRAMQAEASLPGRRRPEPDDEPNDEPAMPDDIIMEAGSDDAGGMVVPPPLLDPPADAPLAGDPPAVEPGEDGPATEGPIVL